MAEDRCELLCLDLDKAERLRAEAIDSATADQLAGRAKALADPTRLMLAVTLAGTDELCVCDLAWISGRAENLVSHHLRILYAEGLVTRRRDGKMVMYAASDVGRSLLAAVSAVAEVAK